MFGPVRGKWPDDAWKGSAGNRSSVPHAGVRADTPCPRAAADGRRDDVLFVTDGIELAFDQAKSAAGGKDILIGGGASTIRQYPPLAWSTRPGCGSSRCSLALASALSNRGGCWSFLRADARHRRAGRHTSAVPGFSPLNVSASALLSTSVETTLGASEQGDVARPTSIRRRTDAEISYSRILYCRGSQRAAREGGSSAARSSRNDQEGRRDHGGAFTTRSGMQTSMRSSTCRTLASAVALSLAVNASGDSHVEDHSALFSRRYG